MKEKFILLLMVLSIVFLVFAANITGFGSGNVIKGVQSSCTTIQKGEIYDSDGSLIKIRFDQWGYNYQAHVFNGGYCDAYKNATWCQPHKDVDLIMKWNDAWLANIDCDGDGLLDKHYGLNSYIGSGAWETNHQNGEYEKDGKTCEWTYFIKIVAAPADAHIDNGTWYTADNVEIGPVIWGSFATIQSVYDNSCAEDYGVEYLSPNSPGFGVY